ncbi:MAG: hypothetical protein WBY44_36460 [Bryobacteraceae bacterium]
MAEQRFKEKCFPKKRYAANQPIRAQIKDHSSVNPIGGGENPLQLDEVLEIIRRGQLIPSGRLLDELLIFFCSRRQEKVWLADHVHYPKFSNG